ncbi:Hypothetical Protein FCC1311_039512 [Hondaea fermentalgiana]|uniref:Polysaccharide pyruvyl transferase domain-containing protein n=1 Tax=Hondaea fermentalgiana TaxID=2315210 RepID=A0A2R5GDD9_9STRA|nr:Hypothetical Protein FCC1311_039512 [Hondaea fermentalgiana]|eukprot:GBG27728.1 Hypothetical Protein FCC1311_039512 [Hondaea fermentalgiana]
MPQRRPDASTSDGAVAAGHEEGDGPRRRGSVPQELCDLHEAAATTLHAGAAVGSAVYQGIRLNDVDVGMTSDGVHLVGMQRPGPASIGNLHNYHHQETLRGTNGNGEEDRARFKRKSSVYLDDRWDGDIDEANAGALGAGDANSGGVGGHCGADGQGSSELSESGPCECLGVLLSQPAAFVLICIWFGLSAIFFMELHESIKGALGAGDVLAQTAVHLFVSCALMFSHGVLMHVAGHPHKLEALTALLDSTPHIVWIVLGFAHLLSHAFLLSGLAVLDVSTLQLAKLVEPAILVAMATLRWVPQTHLPLSTTQTLFGIVLGAGAMAASVSGPSVVSGVILIFLSSALLQWRSHIVRRMMHKVHADAPFLAFGITSTVGFVLALFILVIMYATNLSVFTGRVSVETGLYYFGASAVNLLITQLYSQGAHEGLKLLQCIFIAVLAACVHFEHITVAQWLGIGLVGVGWAGVDMNRHQSSVRRTAALGSLAVLITAALVMGGDDIHAHYGPETWLQERSQRQFTPGISEDGRIEEPRAICDVYEEQLYSIWAYPFSPGPNVNRRCPTEVVYCAFSGCMNRFAGARRLNLKSLVRGTPYETFVRHHMWEKVRLKRQFADHVQSVAMLSLLLKKPGICVRILGQVSWHCHSDRNWPSIDYEPATLSMMPPFMLPNLRELQDQFEEYSSFSYVSHSKKLVGVDLGDELQAFAGLSFMPYLSHFTDRDQGLPDAHGHLFMNTWLGPNVQWPPGPKLDPVMLSVHTSPKFRKQVLGKDISYFTDYNKKHGPVGARDHATLDFLVANGVEAFFSGCFSTIVDVATDVRQPRGNKAFLVDVARTDLIPDGVLNVVERRSVLPALDVLRDEEGVHHYAFHLLRSFAEEAKLVITSRAHIGLAAMAQGVPVIFLKPPRGADATVTDVQGAMGAGMDDIISFFHVLGRDQPLPRFFNWTHPPPNPGNHIVDRHRATFWNYISKRSSVFSDTAFLFGIVPLRRLGHGQPYGVEAPQDVFHIMLPSANAMTNSTMRLAESVFRHHPNARLVVHCNDNVGMRQTELVQLALVGYDVAVESFDMVQQLRQLHLDHNLVKRFVSHMRKFPDDLDILPVLVLFIHGGVFLRNHNGLVMQTIPRSFPSAWQDGADLLLFPKGSPILLRTAELFLRNPQLSIENALVQAINEYTFDAVEVGIAAQSEQPDFTLYGANTTTQVLKLRNGAYLGSPCGNSFPDCGVRGVDDQDSASVDLFEASCIFCSSRTAFDYAAQGF